MGIVRRGIQSTVFKEFSKIFQFFSVVVIFQDWMLKYNFADLMLHPYKTIGPVIDGKCRRRARAYLLILTFFCTLKTCLLCY